MGSAYIEYQEKNGNSANPYTYKIDLGTIVSISRTVNKKTMITPIVSLDMENAFPIESGNSQTLSISFKRTNVADADDTGKPTTLEKSRGRSNQKWYQELTGAIDRWQARTDGCMLYYSETGTDYVPSFNKGCYIKSIDRTYKNDFNEVISGTISFTVGRMYINDNSLDASSYPADQNYEKMQMLMSSSSGDAWYLLMSGEGYSCVDSVTISAGSEQSFESADIIIPRKKLMEFAPALVDDMVYGKNTVSMTLMGNHTMVVAKVDTGDDILIRTYCRAWFYESAKTSSELTGNAWSIIHQILTDNSYGVSFDDKHIIYSYSLDADLSIMTIPEGDNAWRVLQICAYMLRCKIFFADDRAYIVDYTASNPNDMNVMFNSIGVNGQEICRDFINPIYLFLNDSSASTYKRCVGTTKLGKEGIDTLRNVVTIRCRDSLTATQANTSKTISDDSSVAVYKDVDPIDLSIPELLEALGDENQEGYYQASIFGRNYLTYLREPQRSVTFTLKEAFHKQGYFDRVWVSFFGASARAWTIIDSYSGEVVTNKSVLPDKIGEAMPQKLTLSSYKRHYPKGTCEYTFGTISEISLPASTSQVSNALSTRM